MDYIEKIRALNPCQAALGQLMTRRYPTLREAWDNWENPGDMLWLVTHTARPGDMATAVPAYRLAAHLALSRYWAYRHAVRVRDNPVIAALEASLAPTSKPGYLYALLADVNRQCNMLPASLEQDAAYAAYHATLARINAEAGNARGAADRLLVTVSYALQIGPPYDGPRGIADLIRKHIPMPELR